MRVANRENTTTKPLFSHIFLAEPSKVGAKIRVTIMSRFPLSEMESLVQYPAGFSVDLHKPGTDAGDELLPITLLLSTYL